MKLWYKMEYAFHMVEAYLASQRGDMVFRADCLSRAYEAERKLAVMEVQL